MIACSCVPCFAFFAHRTWLMYKRHWIIPVLFLPLICTSGSSFIVIAVLCDNFPMSKTVKALVFALVCPLIRYPYRRIAHQADIVKGSCELAGHLTTTVMLGRKLLQSKTGFKATDSVLTKIFTTLVETQAPPTIA